MQPAFAGSYKAVVMSFGSRVTRYLPREHPLPTGSRTDPPEIVLLKASTFVSTMTRRVFAGILSPQDLNSLPKISNHTPMKILFEIPRAYYGALHSF